MDETTRVMGPNRWNQHVKCFIYCCITLYCLLVVTFGSAVFPSLTDQLPYQFFTEHHKRIGVVGVLLVELVFLRMICRSVSWPTITIGVILLLLGLLAPYVVRETTELDVSYGAVIFNPYAITTGMAMLGCLMAKYLSAKTVYDIQQVSVFRATPLNLTAQPE